MAIVIFVNTILSCNWDSSQNLIYLEVQPKNTKHVKRNISEQLKLVSMGWNTFYLQMRFLFESI